MKKKSKLKFICLIMAIVMIFAAVPTWAAGGNEEVIVLPPRVPQTSGSPYTYISPEEFIARHGREAIIQSFTESLHQSLLAAYESMFYVYAMSAEGRMTADGQFDAAFIEEVAMEALDEATYFFYSLKSGYWLGMEIVGVPDVPLGHPTFMVSLAPCDYFRNRHLPQTPIYEEEETAEDDSTDIVKESTVTVIIEEIMEISSELDLWYPRWNNDYTDRNLAYIAGAWSWFEPYIFSEGLAGVIVNTDDCHRGMMGMIDETGEMIIEPIFRAIHPFQGGYAFARLPTNCDRPDCNHCNAGNPHCRDIGIFNNVVIDRTGQIVREFDFTTQADIDNFRNKIALIPDRRPIHDELDKHGLRNVIRGIVDTTTGEAILSFEYDEIYPFQEGLAMARRGSTWVILRMQVLNSEEYMGNYVICKKDTLNIIIYEITEIHSGSYFWCRGLVNNHTDWSASHTWNAWQQFSPYIFNEGLASVLIDVSINTQPHGNRMMGMIDKTGELVIEPIFMRIYPFQNGHALARLPIYCNNSDCDYHDNQPHLLCFDCLNRHLAHQEVIIDRTGQIVRELDRFWDRVVLESKEITNELDKYGLSIMWYNGKSGIVNASGDIILPFEYDEIFPFNEGLAIARRGNIWVILQMQILNGEERTESKEENQESQPFSNVNVRDGVRDGVPYRAYFTTGGYDTHIEPNHGAFFYKYSWPRAGYSRASMDVVFSNTMLRLAPHYDGQNAYIYIAAQTGAPGHRTIDAGIMASMSHRHPTYGQRYFRPFYKPTPGSDHPGTVQACATTMVLVGNVGATDYERIFNGTVNIELHVSYRSQTLTIIANGRRLDPIVRHFQGISFDRRASVDNGALSFIQAMTLIRSARYYTPVTTLGSGAMLGPVTFRNQRLYAVARGGVTPGGAPYNWQRITPFTFAGGGTRYVYIQNPNRVIYDRPWGQNEERITIYYFPIVRFHFDGVYRDVPVTLGQTIPQHLIPRPATRYGRIGIPGQAFMGWFTISDPNHNILTVPPDNRPIAFDTNWIMTPQMFDRHGFLHLYGSWLQYGDVDGNGGVNMMDFNRLQRFTLGAIDYDEIIAITADVNVDGRVNLIDFNMFQRFLLGDWVIFGVPAP